MGYETIDIGAGERDHGGERIWRDMLVLLAVFGATFMAFGLVRLVG